jgi:uncharacterized protein with PQ loop repeat
MTLKADDVMIGVGTIGGFAISLSLMPQVYLTCKTKCADDISYLYQFIYIFGTALVNTYAIYFGLYAVYIPCLLEFSLIVTLTIMKYIYPSREDLSKESREAVKRHSCSDSAILNASRHKQIAIMKTIAVEMGDADDEKTRATRYSSMESTIESISGSPGPHDPVATQEETHSA